MNLFVETWVSTSSKFFFRLFGIATLKSCLNDTLQHGHFREKFAGFTAGKLWYWTDNRNLKIDEEVRFSSFINDTFNRFVRFSFRLFQRPSSKELASGSLFQSFLKQSDFEKTMSSFKECQICVKKSNSALEKKYVLTSAEKHVKYMVEIRNQSLCFIDNSYKY